MPLEKVKAIHSQTSASTLKEFTSLIEYYEKHRWCNVLQNDAHFDVFGAKYEPEMVWYIIGHIVSNNKLWQPRLDGESEIAHDYKSTFVHGCSDVWESTARYNARLNSIGENDNG